MKKLDKKDHKVSSKLVQNFAQLSYHRKNRCKMATTTKQSEHKSHGMEAHLNILDKVTPVDNHITAV